MVNGKTGSFALYPPPFTVKKESMLEREYTIVNKLGLHARASALLVKTAIRFKSEIRIEREGVEVNGKSIMGIMMLAAAKGSAIKLRISGEDETEAISTLGELIDNGFGED
jgi:phosphocarrier protein HPr